MDRQSIHSNFDLYQAVGGMDTCRKLSVAFYGRVPHDPVLKPLFPSLHCAIEAFTLFLAQFLGGPCEYSHRRWSVSLRETHRRFKIGPAQRDAWLRNMDQALDDSGIEASARAALSRFFEESASYIIDDRSDDRREAGSSLIEKEIALRSEAQRTLEQIVAGVRDGDAATTLSLIESPPAQISFVRDPAAFLSLLGVMSGSRDTAILDYVRSQLTSNPALVVRRYTAGRTLLHDLASTGNPEIAKLLLDLGADPNSVDDFGHAPLYFVCNSETLRAFMQGGANVNAREGVKQCTALHMAARRGNVEVAEALLECGADIELPDSAGESPLRRAVNCGKTAVAKFLLSRGANPQSKGSKGLTPAQAARSVAMKKLFEDR